MKEQSLHKAAVSAILLHELHHDRSRLPPLFVRGAQLNIQRRSQVLQVVDRQTQQFRSPSHADPAFGNELEDALRCPTMEPLAQRGRLIRVLFLGAQRCQFVKIFRDAQWYDLAFHGFPAISNSCSKLWLVVTISACYVLAPQMLPEKRLLRCDPMGKELL